MFLASSRGRCSSPIRVAVCFYGLNRSLRYTMASLRSHILNKLTSRRCVEVETFFHSWTLREEESVRGEAVGAILGEPSELARELGASLKRYRVDDQAAFDAHFNFSRWAEIDPRYAGSNFMNLARQLQSLRLVTRLWTTRDDIPYRAVLYVRPDLLVLDDIDVDQLLGLGPNEFLTPYWHQFSGLNDRVAAGSPRVAKAFGERSLHLEDYARHKFVRSESYLKWIVTEKHRFNVTLMETRAQRMRSNGKVADNDVCLRWCSLSLRKQCRGDCRRVAPESEMKPLPEWARKQQARDHKAGRLAAATNLSSPQF